MLVGAGRRPPVSECEIAKSLFRPVVIKYALVARIDFLWVTRHGEGNFLFENTTVIKPGEKANQLCPGFERTRQANRVQSL